MNKSSFILISFFGLKLISIFPFLFILISCFVGNNAFNFSSYKSVSILSKCSSINNFLNLLFLFLHISFLLLLQLYL